MISGAYDPLRDKIGIALLPVGGAYGDSIRAIVTRDMDFSDRFLVINIDSAEPAALRGQGNAAGLNYPLFSRLNATARRPDDRRADGTSRLAARRGRAGRWSTSASFRCPARASAAIGDSRCIGCRTRSSDG